MSIIYIHSLNEKEIEFTYEFRNKFVEFSNQYLGQTQTFNSQIYEWLMTNTVKIQTIVGYNGIIEYIAPFNKYVVPNYHIIANSIPKFRDGTVSNLDIQWVDDCLLRRMGVLKEKIKKDNREIRNPFMWFGKGIKNLISFPIYMISWLGIIPVKSALKITSNAFFNFISGIASLIVIISGIVTIVEGWDSVIKFIERFF